MESRCVSSLGRRCCDAAIVRAPPLPFVLSAHVRGTSCVGGPFRGNGTPPVSPLFFELLVLVPTHGSFSAAPFRLQALAGLQSEGQMCLVENMGIAL